jgi:hypothetical protein
MVMSPEGVELEFGDLITTRGGGEVKWTLAGLFLAIFGLILLFAVPEVIRGRQGGWIAIGFAVGFGAIGIWCLQLARVKTEFYLHGVIVKRGGRVLRSMPYAVCERFTFGSTRHYYNGFYAGTLVDLRMKAKGWPTIAWNGRHKEKPKGLAVTFLGKEFKGDDELDMIKFVIADHVVEKWMRRLDSGEAIVWNNLQLGFEGITPLKGKRKGTLFEHDRIELSVGSGLVDVKIRGEKWPLAKVSMADEDFWVWMGVWQRVSGVSSDVISDPARALGG